MNSKKAREIRRQVRLLTVGAAGVDYTFKGKQANHTPEHKGQRVLLRQTTRGMAQIMKQAVNKTKKNGRPLDDNFKELYERYNN